jgi:sulfatase modifying factor 1
VVKRVRTKVLVAFAAGGCALASIASCAAIAGLKDSEPYPSEAGAIDAHIGSQSDAAAIDAGALDGSDSAIDSDGAIIDAAIDATPAVPSCVDLPATCGPTKSENCCASMTIGGNTFYRNYDGVIDGGFDDSSHVATISNFVLDRFEVTIGRFRNFLNAGQGTIANPPVGGSGEHPHLIGSGWDPAWNSSLLSSEMLESELTKVTSPLPTPWTQDAGPDETLPMGNIDWYEAFAFCAWDGGFLPTDVELNYAASGGAEQRAYPWSVPSASLVIDETYATYNCGAKYDGGVCLVSDVPSVGTFSPKGDGVWGNADLAGGVWEFALDGTGDAPFNFCTNCADYPTASNMREVRGGSFYAIPARLRSANFTDVTTIDRAANIGVRCARATDNCAPGMCEDSAARHFTLGTNGDAQWSFGHEATATSPFVPYNSSGTTSEGLQIWQVASAPTTGDASYAVTVPAAFFSPFKTQVTFSSTVVMQPMSLAIHPGPTTVKSVVRWTAPSAGLAFIDVYFTGANTPILATTDVEVLHNANVVAPLFASGINITPDGGTAPYSNVAHYLGTIPVAAGDMIDFVVGNGNGSYSDDSTALDAVIRFSK